MRLAPDGDAGQPDLIIPVGKRKGRNPSLASIYRILAEHEKAQACPEAIEAAHADFAALASQRPLPEWLDMPRPSPCAGDKARPAAAP